ncbi:MAG TPA: hypothetical protein PLU87_17710 [Sedimentisphaerales bacterium]|nr:hypothetical protein [Sedimentisphaerales bacterium]HRS12849.1 hypothetical protein [Sedimentisphaerales bacterium]HRV49460.1 hypothetical protein [Sedimentisphaerales bacterium]
MNETDRDQDRIERLMKAAALPGPSDALKAHVIAAAQKAWRRDSIDVPARIGLRRLAAAAAAAVIVIALADRYGDRTVSPWRSGKIAVAMQEPVNLEALLGSPDLAAAHLRLRGRPSAIGASTLREYVARIRQILDETQGSANVNPSTLVEGQSRVIPTQTGFGSYS